MATPVRAREMRPIDGRDLSEDRPLLHLVQLHKTVIELGVYGEQG